jgi:A/G-specific adenine glycosylase
VAIEPAGLLKTLKHGVRRFRITLECYEGRPVGGRVRSSAARPVCWTKLGKLAELPLSVTGRTIARLINAARG